LVRLKQASFVGKQPGDLGPDSFCLRSENSRVFSGALRKRRIADRPEKNFIYRSDNFSVFITLGLIGSLLISRQILDPIGRLDKAFRIVSSGDLAHQIEATSADEIGSLTRSFNAMRDTIKVKIQVIQEQNLNLEKKVEERTCQLEEQCRKITVLNQEMGLEIQERKKAEESLKKTQTELIQASRLAG